MKIALLVLLACVAVSMAAIKGPFVYPNAAALANTRVRTLPGHRAECAILIQALIRGIGATRTWIPGPWLKDNRAAPAGTAAATFRGTKRDPYNKNHERHTLFYISQGSGCLNVVHQWRSLTRIRADCLAWRSCKRVHMCGDQYYVIMARTAGESWTFPPKDGSGAASTPSTPSTPSGNSEAVRPQPRPQTPSTPSTPSGGGGTKDQLQAQVRAILKARFVGVGERAISGIMGNIEAETGSFDYRMLQRGGNGYGLFQYDYMRRYYMRWLAARGKSQATDSAELQIEWAHSLIFGPNLDIMGSGHARRLKNILVGGGSPEAMARAFCDIFEKPGVPHMDRRIRSANQDYARFGGGRP